MCADDPLQFARIVGYDKYADEDLAPPGLQLLIERVVKRVRWHQAPDEAVVETILTERLPPVFDVLDRVLAEDRRNWFMGDTFSYADIALAAHLSDLPLAGMPLDADRWPTLSAWFERAAARPSIASSIEAARRFASAQ